MGVVDTWGNIVQMYQVTKEVPNIATDSFVRLNNCMAKGMTYNQIFAIVEKFMADDPSQWHTEMSSIVWAAINNACPRQ